MTRTISWTCLILLTDLLTPDLDKPGPSWIRQPPQPLRAGLSDKCGLAWTTLILLRIRRLGVRVPPSAPTKPQVRALPREVGEALNRCPGARSLTISHRSRRSCGF